MLDYEANLILKASMSSESSHSFAGAAEPGAGDPTEVDQHQGRPRNATGQELQCMCFA